MGFSDALGGASASPAGLVGFFVTVILIALVTVGLILARLYRKSTKELAFVRTGLWGEKVVMNGGAIVLPVFHDTIPVNMNTLRLEVLRRDEEALITRDRMRVDVRAEFYVRVAPNLEAISTAAQTLGQRTMKIDALRGLIEGKFVDVLRSVAAEMAMEELHEKRSDFVQRVQNNVRVDLEKNGLELESVSLTGLDQTDPKFFRPENAFDAEGLTQLTKITESRRRMRNEVVRDTEVQIEQKNQETEKQKLDIARDQEYAHLAQKREIAVRRAEQEATIAQEQAQKKQESSQAQIEAARQVDTARLGAERAVAEERIIKERIIKERELEMERALEVAEIEKQKAIELAQQARAVAIAEKSKEESMAQAQANQARASAVREEEGVKTVRETVQAERIKEITLIEARRAAEQAAIGVVVEAEASKRAAEDRAEAMRIEAQGRADQIRIQASGEAQAERERADAKKAYYLAEAEGKRALHEAENLLSEMQIEMKLKLDLYRSLPGILAEVVKPMEKIEGIRIYQVDGLSGGGGGSSTGAGGGNLADQAVDAALRYQAQAPLVRGLVQELGLEGLDLSGLLKKPEKK